MFKSMAISTKSKGSRIVKISTPNALCCGIEKKLKMSDNQGKGGRLKTLLVTRMWKGSREWLRAKLEITGVFVIKVCPIMGPWDMGECSFLKKRNLSQDGNDSSTNDTSNAKVSHVGRGSTG